MNSKPLIGIVPDFETAATYSSYPWYALRENYVTAISDTGGIAIIIPYESSAIEDYHNMLDGLVLTGGNFDIDPSYYGEEITSDKIGIKDKRTAFEFEIFMKSFNNNIPILGICGGEQLINVGLKGSLIQHIPDAVMNSLEHEQKIEKHLANHVVNILPNTLLHKIIGRTTVEVNSTHHQAVKVLGNNLEVCATAPDGIIEAIEATNCKFCIGVQWHPEYRSREHDHKLFGAFIDACRS
jgi:putative glutamine amidotransferase